MAQEESALSTFDAASIDLDLSSAGRVPRNRLILIKRSGSRRFTKQARIEAAVSRAAADYGLDYYLFDDQHLPSLNETMLLFHSAVMVVAPHGAGLSNIVFSRPGTYVIEAVCNSPHINLCFQRLAVVLGHHWHGVQSTGGCEKVIDVAVADVWYAVVAYLDIRKITLSAKSKVKA